MKRIALTDDLLMRAFELAYFILGDRTASIYVAIASIDKLKIAATIQDRRLYYAPRGRSAYAAARTKVNLSSTHLLQRLVYTESEPFERLLEGQQKSLRQRDMVVRFIKHLVKVTTKHNSFYVALGLCRLLYNYTTSESIEIYNFVIQDPDRGKDDYYYRSRKKHLLAEMKQRFGDFLHTQRGKRGEERFQSEDDSGRYVTLVKECLFHFMPWKSECVLPADIDPTKNIVLPLQFKNSNPDAEHEIELNRIHTLLHPDCFERVVKTLGFAAPATRLEVPRFLVSDDGSPTDRPKPQPLSEGELRAMRVYLERNEDRRKNTTRKLFAVLVDADELGCFDLEAAGRVQLEVEKDSDFIEVRSIESDDEVVMAIHAIPHDEAGNGIKPSSINLGRGQWLQFTILPEHDSSNHKTTATVDIRYQKRSGILTNLSSRLHSFITGLMNSIEIQRLNNFRRSEFALASIFVAGSLLGIFIYWWSRTPKDQQFVSQRQEEVPQSKGLETSVPKSPGREPETQTESRSQPPPGRNVKPGLPRGGVESRVPFVRRGASEKVESTRGRITSLHATKLLDLKRVYVDSLGDGTVNLTIRETLIKRLKSSGRFTVVEKRIDADAVFKGSVNRLSRKIEGQVVVALRVVNAKGEVVWSTSSRNKRNYAGDPTEVIDSVMRDLLADIQERRDDHH